MGILGPGTGGYVGMHGYEVDRANGDMGYGVGGLVGKYRHMGVLCYIRCRGNKSPIGLMCHYGSK